MRKVEYVRAEELEPGDEIAHPPSGALYRVATVKTTDGTTEVRYTKNHRGTLGVNVKAKRIMTRWRNYG